MIPYETNKARMLAATVAYWATIGGATTDHPQPLDKSAENITAPNSRNCTAIVAGALGGAPTVAMNSWQSGPVAHEFPQGYQQVKDTTAARHAEMKMLDFFAVGALPHYIAISKPCCLRCAVVLAIAGVQARGSSGGIWDAGWAFPDYIARNGPRLAVFMGGANTTFLGSDGREHNVVTYYQGLSNAQQADFRGLMQTAQNTAYPRAYDRLGT